ncbi:MAG: hypothetical protein QW057_07245 [Candidatus Bathyarchaeia archaeon]
MSTRLLVKNGFVFDPANNVHGDVMDIAVKDGRVVEDVDASEAYVIDATGMVVMPGGVDIHSPRSLAQGRIEPHRRVKGEHGEASQTRRP